MTNIIFKKTLIPEIDFRSQTACNNAVLTLTKRIGVDNTEKWFYMVSRFDNVLKDAMVAGTDLTKDENLAELQLRIAKFRARNSKSSQFNKNR